MALIMDGNGRWAQARGLPRTAGHRAGVQSVRRVVEAAPQHGIGTLTLYAFSTQNWRRPVPEVESLFALLRAYLWREARNLAARGVRLRVIGRRDRLGPGLRTEIERAEATTARGESLELRLAIDYSARDAITAAAHDFAPGVKIDPDDFSRALARVLRDPEPAPDVDLLIRTGGERRLSDFLLWECAQAELLFTQRMWPDFDAGDLTAALEDFRARDRRFGGLPSVAV